LANKMIDIPNARSSHTVPTPRGGGLAIVIIVIGGSVLLGLANVLAWNIVGAVAAGGLVAYIGYRDDQGGLSPRTRALVHFAAAIIAVILLGGMPPLDLGFTTFHWAFLGNVVAVVGIVWLINLY